MTTTPAPGLRFTDPKNGKTYQTTDYLPWESNGHTRVRVALVKDGVATNFTKNAKLSDVLAALA